MLGLFRKKKMEAVIHMPTNTPTTVIPEPCDEKFPENKPNISQASNVTSPKKEMTNEEKVLAITRQDVSPFKYIEGIESHSEWDFRKDYDKYFSKDGMDRKMFNLIRQLFDPSFIEALNSAKAAKAALEALGDAADKDALTKVTATVDNMEKSIAEKKKIFYADVPEGCEIKAWFDDFGFKDHINQLAEKYGWRFSSIYSQDGNNYINAFSTTDICTRENEHGWYFKFIINVGTGNKISDIMLPVNGILEIADEYLLDMANDNVVDRMDREVCHVFSFPEWLVRMRCDKEDVLKVVADSCVVVIDKNKDCHVTYRDEDTDERIKSQNYIRTGSGVLDTFGSRVAKHLNQELFSYFSLESAKRNSYAEFDKK